MDTLKRDVVSPLWHQWHSIEWSAVSGRVRRLQARIAKAAKESDWRKVRQLQRLKKIYEREGTSHQASNRKPRPQNPRYRRGIVVNARSKMGSAANLG